MLKKRSLDHEFFGLEEIRWIELPDETFLITGIGKTPQKILEGLKTAPAVNTSTTS